MGFPLTQCLGVGYRTPRLKVSESGTGHRASPIRNGSGSGSDFSAMPVFFLFGVCLSVPIIMVAGQLGLKSSWPLSQLGPGSTRPKSTRSGVSCIYVLIYVYDICFDSVHV